MTTSISSALNREPQIASYGSWKSPITAEVYATSFLGVNEPAIDGGQLYWKESRPKEGGRSVIVRLGDGGAAEVANAAVLMASDYASAITATVVKASGGELVD